MARRGGWRTLCGRGSDEEARQRRSEAATGERDSQGKRVQPDMVNTVHTPSGSVSASSSPRLSRALLVVDDDDDEEGC